MRNDPFIRLREMQDRDTRRNRDHAEMMRARRDALPFDRGPDGAWRLADPDRWPNPAGGSKVRGR